MSQLFHIRRRLIVECILERDLCRDQLIVDSGLGQSRPDVETAVEDVQEVLDGGGDDAGAACGANGDVEGGGCGEGFVGVEMLYYYGGYGAEGSFAWADEVCGGGNVAEGVCGVGDGEVLG
jgi:hypothetical protein